MIHYSKKLNQHFNLRDDGSVVFEDETHYSKEEMYLIGDSSNDGIRAIHGIKKIFLAEVVS